MNVHRSILTGEKVGANLENQDTFHLMAFFPGSRHLRMVESSWKGED